MKKRILCAALLCALVPAHARKQMTVAQAWKWQREMGEIRGFNQPEPAYPGMQRDQILRKASELGLNSVRSWVGGGTVEEQIAFIRTYAEDCARYGLTYSPVLSFYDRYYHDTSIPEDERLKRTEAYIRAVVRAFAGDRRIAMWDIWNEPSTSKTDETMRQMDWLEKMVLWCRSENPIQPITSSILWEGGEYDTTSTHYRRRMEIEAMMDIHNIHNYRFLEPEHDPPAHVIQRMKAMDGRPLVSSECMARTVSGGLTRSLKLFAREHVNFYLWGMFLTDSRNWSVQWGRSTYDPYEPIFHDLLYSDGSMYDARELDALRKFRFEAPDEQIYPPLSQTERWPAERAWKWVASGPVKGVSVCGIKVDGPGSGQSASSKEQGGAGSGQSASTSQYIDADAYNSVRIKLNYRDFAADEDAFMADFERQLEAADRAGMTVLPVLLTDRDILDARGEEIPQARFLRTYPNDFAENGDGYLTTPFRNALTPERAGNRGREAHPQATDSPYWGTDFAPSLRISREEAAKFASSAVAKNIMAYVNVILRRHYIDPRIQGWELYFQPAASDVPEREASMWVSQLFDLVRFISPTQPVFMTPMVSVGDFSADTRYREELIHGRHGGWGRLKYGGLSSAALVYKIWALSDVAAFSSTMRAAETGWLVSICYRFGRPVYCTSWLAPDEEQARATLEIFSRSHVFWYTVSPVSASDLKDFRFRPINTDRDSANLVP